MEHPLRGVNVGVQVLPIRVQEVGFGNEHLHTYTPVSHRTGQSRQQNLSKGAPVHMLMARPLANAQQGSTCAHADGQAANKTSASEHAQNDSLGARGGDVEGGRGGEEGGGDEGGDSQELSARSSTRWQCPRVQWRSKQPENTCADEWRTRKTPDRCIPNVQHWAHVGECLRHTL